MTKSGDREEGLLLMSILPLLWLIMTEYGYLANTTIENELIPLVCTAKSTHPQPGLTLSLTLTLTAKSAHRSQPQRVCQCASV